MVLSFPLFLFLSSPFLFLVCYKRELSCICVHTHPYTHTHIHTYTHPYTHTHIHTYIHTHIHTYTHTHIHTHIHTYIHTYTHTHIHTHIHTYTHTYIHTYTHTHIHTYTHTQLLLSITSLMLRHMIHEISDYSSSSGSCLSRNHSKTAPTLVNVTPAPVPIPYTSPHEAWSLENNPFMQGFNNHNVPRLAPPVTTTTAIATHSQRRRHDEQRTRHLNFESTQL